MLARPSGPESYPRHVRAQDPRAPFVAAFIHELVSEGRHDPNQIKGLILTNNPGLVLAARFQEGPRPYCCAASSAVTIHPVKFLAQARFVFSFRLLRILRRFLHR
jgi:hypothetical protein